MVHISSEYVAQKLQVIKNCSSHGTTVCQDRTIFNRSVLIVFYHHHHPSRFRPTACYGSKF